MNPSRESLRYPPFPLPFPPEDEEEAEAEPLAESEPPEELPLLPLEE